MAYDDSGELPASQSTYSLGGYTFELKVQTVHEPGEPDVVSVYAICRGPDGTRETKAIDLANDVSVDGWFVENNESEASVYVQYRDRISEERESEFDLYPIIQPVPIGTSYNSSEYDGQEYDLAYSKVAYFDYITGPNIMYYDWDRTWESIIIASGNSADTYHRHKRNGNRSTEFEGDYALTSSYTFDGKTVYFVEFQEVNEHYKQTHGGKPPIVFEGAKASTSGDGRANAALVAWTMVYGTPSGDFGDPKEALVGRFAIDIREADGGPDGDWDEPGDVGPDPEKHFTLTVSVTGASAGSNSGTPLEPGQAGGYGNGGTGGNGGGGGAGASTVIIYEFATSKADNVVQEATAQGPGTGGPGGKGGKGGDGCILIFY